MKKNNIDLLDYVKECYNSYIEYETAFEKEPYTDINFKEDIQSIIDEDLDTDSDLFFEKVSPIIMEKSRKKADVLKSAIKFYYAVKTYQHVEEKELPDSIELDFKNLPEEVFGRVNCYHVVSKGKFEVKEKVKLDDNNKNALKNIFNSLKKEFEDE